MGINDRLRSITADQRTPQTLGRQLRIARERAGVEQGELAEALGISRQSVSSYEHDRVIPTRGTVIAMAVLLGADFAPLDEAHKQVAEQRHEGARHRHSHPFGVVDLDKVIDLRDHVAHR